MFQIIFSFKDEANAAKKKNFIIGLLVSPPAKGKRENPKLKLFFDKWIPLSLFLSVVRFSCFSRAQSYKEFYAILIFKHSDWLLSIFQPIRIPKSSKANIYAVSYIYRIGTRAQTQWYIFYYIFYSTLIFKHSDWLLNFFNQSEGLKLHSIK